MLHIQAPHNSKINTTTDLLLFSCSVMSNSLWSHGLQHARCLCPWDSPWPSLSSQICSNSCPLCRCHPTISSCATLFSSWPQSFSASGVFFPKELALCSRWPKYWSFNFSISPSKEYSRLISFRIDWFDLLAVQGTLKSHSSKASILGCSASFTVQLSHLYICTGRTIALTRQTFVSNEEWGSILKSSPNFTEFPLLLFACNAQNIAVCVQHLFLCSLLTWLFLSLLSPVPFLLSF